MFKKGNDCTHDFERSGGVGAGLDRFLCAECGYVQISLSGETPITAVSSRLHGESDQNDGTEDRSELRSRLDLLIGS
jgi:hypothetical protein